ncbi:nuclear transport factor 2 family protein [Polyangium aurulentum]|uniref:nuclear transport factor 2 family protein n=1 Tax=Polyangium aurulentum TaxID=2567896 RepID=UPI0010AED165|nr:nuclear transport factor 2 family protein [Polyangium aurulentum]UQA58678.1 nuclear transport factor 2 family protein [Polyangium aurulentum]
MNTAIHPNVETLRAIYADLTRLGDHAADDIVLHTAERELCIDIAGRRAVGKEAVVAKEIDLIRATGGTLVMDVEHITANDHFGAVFGVLRAQLGGETLAMPFCGLWRFRDGLITEHWENAYDVTVVQAFLAGKTGSAPT